MFELAGHVHDEAHAYQLGTGRQLNVENMYLGARQLLPSSLSVSALAPLVRDADPLALGVQRAAIADGNAVPPYIPRDADPILDRELTRSSAVGGFLLIVGDSTAGKTRFAFEGLLRVQPDRRLLAPFNKDEMLYYLASMITTPERPILWLDNIERFLGNDGLTPRMMVNLKHLNVLVIGSIRVKHYTSLSKLNAVRTQNNSKVHSELIASEYVLNQATVIHLERRWTADERSRADRTNDPRIKDALQHASLYGVSEYLAAGPMLFDEWHLAWGPDQNPRGAALVRAAIDCQRAGLHGFVPLDLLRLVHQHYLDEAGGSLLRPEPFEKAIAWAAQRRWGITSLLLPGKDGESYRAFDYLTDRVMETSESNLVPNSTWSTVTEFLDDNVSALEEVAIAAMSQANYVVAESIWKRLAVNDNAEAMYRLGLLYRMTDRDDDAVAHYKLAVELGSMRAAIALGHFYQRTGNIEAAETWFARAADGQDPHGMYHIGIICSNRGDEQLAEKWFRKALRHKELMASSALGSLLEQSGRLEEAESTLREGVKGQDMGSAVNLGILLANLGRLNEAEKVWRVAAQQEVPQAEANLAKHCAESGRFAEAEKWYKRAIGHGLDSVLVPYGIFLAERKQAAKARNVLRRAVSIGDARAYRALARICVDSGDHLGAIDWLNKALAVDEFDLDLICGMADTLANAGKVDEAVPYWQKLVDAGDSDATYALGRILRANGDLEGSARLFRIDAENGDAIAACQLGQIYMGQGERSFAEKWLIASWQAGHAHAACLLGSVYFRIGDLEGAERFWTHGYEGGHKHLARDLADLMSRQGRGREAGLWIRRSNELDPKPHGKRSRSGKRRPRRR